MTKIIKKNHEGFEIPTQIYKLFDILVKCKKKDCFDIYISFGSWMEFIEEVDSEENIKDWITVVLINFCHYFIKDDDFVTEIISDRKKIKTEITSSTGANYDLYLILLAYISTKYKTTINELIKK